MTKDFSSATRFEIARHLAARRIFIGFAAFLAVLAWGSVNNSLPTGYSDGVMLGTMLWLNFHMNADRSANFDAFMRNHLDVAVSFGAKVCAVCFLFLTFIFMVWLVLAALMLHPVALLWYAANALLFASLIFGLSLLLETVVNFSAPGFLAAFLFGATLMIFVTHGQNGMEAMARIGLGTRPGSYYSLVRLAEFSVALNVVFGVLAFLIYSFRHRRKYVISAHEPKRT